MCENVKIVNPYSVLLHICMICQVHRAYRTMWWERLSVWSGQSRLYPIPNMISPLVWHSLLQLVLGLTAQLDLQSMVGCCQVESPLTLALGPTVNTLGKVGPGYKAWEWIRTTFVCKTIEEKCACIVIHFGNMYLYICSVLLATVAFRSLPGSICTATRSRNCNFSND